MVHAVILINVKKTKATLVQEKISASADLIKARMGFHESLNASATELIILHVKPVKKAETLATQLDIIPGVKAQFTKI